MGLRNTVVNAWLHRPARSALRLFAFSLADAPKNLDYLRAVGLILRAFLDRPGTLRLLKALDADLRLLDDRRVLACGGS